MSVSLSPGSVWVLQTPLVNPLWRARGRASSQPCLLLQDQLLLFYLIFLVGLLHLLGSFPRELGGFGKIVDLKPFYLHASH